jgi:hydroxymethylbilane synthase
MLPEVGQGFLALQTRAAEASLLARVNDADGLRVLRAERAAAGTFGGGCLAPVAAHAELLATGSLRLRVWIGLPDGSASASASGDGDDPDALGLAVARQALETGGQPLLEASGA